jgi:hypothetical protein
MYKFDLISLLVTREVDFLVVQSHMAYCWANIWRKGEKCELWVASGFGLEITYVQLDLFHISGMFDSEL